MKTKKFEKLPLLLIYKDGDKLFAETPEFISDNFQLYGFLKIFIKFMEEDLLEDMEFKEK